MLENQTFIQKYIVIELGGNKVTDMMSYMKALSAFKKGDKTTVILTRSGKEVKAEIQF